MKKAREKEFYYKFTIIGFYNGCVRECFSLKHYKSWKDVCDASAERVGILKRKGWAIGQQVIEAIYEQTQHTTQGAHS